MLRLVAWTLPLLLAALVSATGCNFAKSIGLVRNDSPPSDMELAEADATAAPSDPEIERSRSSLVHTLRKPADWFSFARRDSRDTELASSEASSESAQSAESQGRTGSQPLSYPNVVPSKYRSMDAQGKSAELAESSSASPSLVRPSRRPPPDPAPKPPEADDLVTPSLAAQPSPTAAQPSPTAAQPASPTATQPAAASLAAQPRSPLTRPALAPATQPVAVPTAPPQETLVAPRPGDGPLYDLIARAARAWRIESPERATRAPATAPSESTAPAPAAQSLAHETNLKFNTPDLGDRNQQRTTRSLNIATNILRPAAQSRPAPAGQSGTHTTAAPPSKSTVYVPTTTWTAKRPPATPPAVASTPSPVSTSPPVVAGRAPAESPKSAAVANTFGAVGGKREAAQTVAASPASQQPARDSLSPAATPVRPSVTVPPRTQALARTETAPADAQSQKRPAYLTKTPSAVRPNVPTNAAPPMATPQIAHNATAAPVQRESLAPQVAPGATTAPAHRDSLAPLVDAQTYRAQTASTPADQAPPLHMASRPTGTVPPGSWMATYQRLIEQADARSAPRPPAGSPTRSLSSDDAPALPEMPPPTLRR